MKNRLLTLAALSLSVMLGLSACTGGAGSAEQDGGTKTGNDSGNALDIEKVNTFEEITANPEVQKLIPDQYKSGGFTIVLSAASPPLNFFSSDGTTVLGSNADITRALIRVMGVDAEIVAVPFDSIIPGLLSEKYAIAMAAMVPTEERLKQLDMIPFVSGGSAVGVAPGNPDDLSLKMLCGKRLAVVAGSTQATLELPALNEEYCSEADQIQAVTMQDANQTRLALNTGRVDAFMGDSIAMSYAEASGDAKFEMLPEEIVREGEYGNLTAAAAAKGSDLTPALEKALQVFVDMPEYEEILQRWGLDEYMVAKGDVRTLG